MKNTKEEPSEKKKPNIAKFLLRDTVSLRNEAKFTSLEDMVHPLTFTHDLKKHPEMDLVSPMDKVEGKKLKEQFDKLYQ